MSSNNPTKPRVFISYSHKDEEWKDRFVPQLLALEQAGRIVVWDDRKIDGGEKWYPEIKRAMEEAAVAVCIISPDYLASGFCVKEEVPFLLQRCEQDGMIFIPMLLRPCPWKAFEWLKEIQMLPRDGQNVVVDFRGIEDAVFADVANLILKIVDNPAEYKLPTPPPPIWAPPEKVDIERLPITGAELFGRQQELGLLDKAWESADTNVVSLVAWGGVGKSTLVNKWLARMQADNYRGARRVFAWSFYSQGTGERVTSADQFINHALTWFGDPDPTAGSSWDKGERLAKLIEKEKTLLVLDGLEPLQSAEIFERGKIKEPALVTLLSELARMNSGLCLITTREKVVDLEQFSGQAIQENLEQISDEAGRALLRVGGVNGTDAQLEQATRNFGNHALAINLLAVYLRDIPGQHVSHASEILDLDIGVEKGKHPRRVMAALARRLGDGPEVELLKMLGLFDRPADERALRVLRKAPVIPGLSDHVRRLTNAAWVRTIEKLREYQLIAPRSEHCPGDLDAHPLVREHFGEQLKQENSGAWRAAHNRLYEHLKRTAKVFPATLVEMAPLYEAVMHGCEAGREVDALSEIYNRRILRGRTFFSKRKLGAWSADLSALSHFFSNPWIAPVDQIKGRLRGFVFNDVGWTLKAMGRLREAIIPMQSALDSAISLETWEDASMAATNLSEVTLSLGDLVQLLLFARQSVEFADKSRSPAKQIISRATLADALHRTGRLKEAEDLFREAEARQREISVTYELLYSIPGYYYHQFMLGQGKYREVLSRTKRLIHDSRPSDSLLTTTLPYLSQGCAYLLKTKQEGGVDFMSARECLQRALADLRKSGELSFVPYGLLARAELFRTTAEPRRAEAHLEEAMRIASRGDMRLHEADCHLEYARLFVMSEGIDATITKKNNAKAREHWVKAKEMIERMGYHRRDKDVKEIEAQLA
jgi:tetratricopeptide (TPR) repeat protein